jgi:hypothetical protein
MESKKKLLSNPKKLGVINTRSEDVIYYDTHEKIFTNLRYRESGYVNPMLKCLKCSNNVFKHHTNTMSSRKRIFVTMGEDMLGKQYNIFTCNKCGFLMKYSGAIEYVSNMAQPTM